MSTGFTETISYKEDKYFKSLANVAGSQETYTILDGLVLIKIDKNSSLAPFLGGSIITTSYLTP